MTVPSTGSDGVTAPVLDGATATPGLTAAEAVPETPAEFDEQAAKEAAALLAAEEEARRQEAAAAARAAAVAAAVAPSPEELAALAAEAEAARPQPRTLAPMIPTSAADGAGEASAATASRRLAARQASRRLAGFAVGAAFLVLGIAVGYSLFQSTRPVVQPVGDPAVEGVQTPTAVTEFIAALSSTDADALRSTLAPPVYDLLAGELAEQGFQQVESVEVLATMQDGTRSATEIIMKGVAPNGAPVVWNLIVHTLDNQIETFR